MNTSEWRNPYAYSGTRGINGKTRAVVSKHWVNSKELWSQICDETSPDRAFTIKQLIGRLGAISHLTPDAQRFILLAVFRESQAPGRTHRIVNTAHNSKFWRWEFLD